MSRSPPDGSRARWEARYTYGGRPVHNVIEARFEFAGGKIARHVDDFDLHRWTRFALGPVGTLLGWTTFFRAALRRRAAEGLDAYLERAAQRRPSPG